MHRLPLVALAALLSATPLAAQNVSGYRYSLRMTSSSVERPPKARFTGPAEVMRLTMASWL